MNKVILGLTALALCIVPALSAQKPKLHGASGTSVARGKYLVENIAMCQDCHTTRNERGELNKDQWLKGATLGFKPMGPAPVWADTAPNIAGLPGWEKDAAIRFMMTGVAPNGLPARPPMPQFRFNVQDAQAVVAYLKSLAPGK